ncbi:hypothetical protein O181_049399 [Austropuccinia psidii MF-1]|uniref:Uncharacterized protein n=1 Tax=Austropuccinia psidii MF-1 TaxID=1389203 RepID=A0A9Q3DUU2_9BASI|nr:hypothetical protein [Austropuccinia psidii MF-1]
MSKLNKHQTRFCGQFDAWAHQAPGPINPTIDSQLSAKEQELIIKELVKDLVATQVSFSIFETARFQSVLNHLALNFKWPRRRSMATMATQLYYEGKD